MNKFYKKLLKNNALYLVGILVLSVVIFFVGMSMSDSVTKINQQHLTLATRLNSLRSLATLRADYEKAKPYFSFLENILPARDQLLSFENDMRSLANKEKLNPGFSFTSEKASMDTEPGALSFRMTLEGSYDGFVNFLNDVESSRYFIDVSDVDLSSKGTGYAAIINGKVFFR